MLFFDASLGHSVAFGDVMDAFEIVNTVRRIIFNWAVIIKITGSLAISSFKPIYCFTKVKESLKLDVFKRDVGEINLRSQTMITDRQS